MSVTKNKLRKNIALVVIAMERFERSCCLLVGANCSGISVCGIYQVYVPLSELARSLPGKGICFVSRLRRC